MKSCLLKIKPDLNQTFIVFIFRISVCSYILLLWGESTDAHSCGVRLDDPINLADVLRRHPEARAHPAHRAVGRRHKRVRSCNDIRGEVGPYFLTSHLLYWSELWKSDVIAVSWFCYVISPENPTRTKAFIFAQRFVTKPAKQAVIGLETRWLLRDTHLK